MALAAASSWNVVAAVAAIVAASALLVGVAQLVVFQREQLKLQRTEHQFRLHEQELERYRVSQQLETDRLWVELLSRQLELQAVLSRGPSAGKLGSSEPSPEASIRERKLAFLARRRIESVALADKQLRSSEDDISFAAGAAERLGRIIAAHNDAT
jgi:hypothetical protein